MIYFAIALGLFAIFLGMKNDRTYTAMITIGDAIYMYRLACICDEVAPLVDYNDVRSYQGALLRFWDWGYKHLLPKEKFEIVEPYLFTRRRNDYY